MSNFADWGENWVCDFIRGSASPLPAEFSVGLLSAVADDSFTEVSWGNYSRKSVARSLAAWSGTQGFGSTDASTGTSHTTANNINVSFGNANGAGTVNAVGLFAGNNLFAYCRLEVPIDVVSGDPVTLDPYSIVFTLGETGGLSDTLSNSLIDHIWRGVAYTYPTTTYLALHTYPPSRSDAGTEVIGGGYSRVAIASSAWGNPSDGTISNSATLTFSAPTSDWGTITGCGIFTNQTGGDLLWGAPVVAAKTILEGGVAPRFNSGSITLQVM